MGIATGRRGERTSAILGPTRPAYNTLELDIKFNMMLVWPEPGAKRTHYGQPARRW